MRALACFLLGFLPLPILDGLQLLPHMQGGRALATVLVGLAGAALGAACLGAHAVWRRRSGAQQRDAAALALALGLALALVPQLAPLTPIASWRGRISYHPGWALLTTLAGMALLTPLLARLLRGRAPRARTAVLLCLAGWTLTPAGFALLDAKRAQEAAGSLEVLARPTERGPDVTILVLDTLRAGGVTGSWEGQPVMPRVAERLADAREFTRAYSSSNSTPPGHATLFTGLYPADCGTLVKGFVRLDRRYTTLAEVLRARGYRTLGVTSNVRLDGSLGFAQGFEIWDDSLVVDPSGRAQALRRVSVSSLVRAVGGKWLMLGLKGVFERRTAFDQNEITAAHTTARVEAALDGLDPAPDEPVLLFVNYIDPHITYETRPEFARDFGPNVADPELDGVRGEPVSFLMRVRELADELQRTQGEPSAAAAERLRWLREAYWEQCRQLEDGLLQLFDALERRGLLDAEDLLVITSDHGEQLGEHGEFLHGTTLFEPVIRVPLILKGGGLAAGADDRAASLADLMPTVLAALRLPDPEWPAGLAGRPLQGPDDPDRWLRHESGDLRGIQRAGRKMIARDHGDRLEWLAAYDLNLDPEETRNLLGADAPEWVREVLAAPPIAPLRGAGAHVEGEGLVDLAELGYADEAAPR